MKIAVLSNENTYQELTELPNQIVWLRVASIDSLLQAIEVDALINLNEDAGEKNYSSTNLPVFVNSVSQTLKENNHTKNIVRINGWQGFLKRSCWEISGQLSKDHEAILTLLEKSFSLFPDEPGFVSARIIAMIINEAYFAKEEQISTEEEIDTALKLGTNYPKGPFEWGKEIGQKNVYSLLKKLSLLDKRYTPSKLLEAEALQS